jgi:hypothetical protein
LERSREGRIKGLVTTDRLALVVKGKPGSTGVHQGRRGDARSARTA